MDDQWRPGSPHNHCPQPCQAHHGNHTAVDGHNEADRLYTRARIDAIGRQLSGVPPLPPFYHHSTRPRGLEIVFLAKLLPRKHILIENT
ncbi:unnamed protein product [Brassica napus]|uniref:(rape) hypothetical protein n=1 Tax=Brassica napus TaxID=3708 RepID=A0A816VW13_BRANA|nr:unnamed protein product [Brassica napus]